MPGNTGGLMACARPQLGDPSPGGVTEDQPLRFRRFQGVNFPLHGRVDVEAKCEQRAANGKVCASLRSRAARNHGSTGGWIDWC